MLAAGVGRGSATWRAYLSQASGFQGPAAINARDRIGTGPWYNANGAMIAANVADLHGDIQRDRNNIRKPTALDEKGEEVKGVGDQPNQHDMLTGSDSHGRVVEPVGTAAATTCDNWTSNGDGAAIVGHHDRLGGPNASWNSAHSSRGCSQENRVVALKKNLSVERGELVLFDEIRYFFYITNDATLSCDEVVREARQRCDQENLIAQLKGGVRALHAPVNTLHANWAYMVMASLAWSLKAWTALWLPIVPRWRARHEAEQRRLLRMDFRTFLGAFINVPCQILTSGRRLIYRLLAWNPWQSLFLRFVDAT